MELESESVIALSESFNELCIGCPLAEKHGDFVPGLQENTIISGTVRGR